MGGLLVSQFLTLYTTPIVYIYLDRVAGWLGRHRPRSPVQRAESTEMAAE